MNRTGERGRVEAEGSERKRGAIEQGARETAGEDTQTMSYTELIENLNSLSKRIKDGKHSSIEPQQQSSIRSTAIPLTPSSAGPKSSGDHALICDSLDSLLTHYSTNYLSGTAEDKLMKNDLENVRSYLRRKKSKKLEEMKRSQVNRPTARRFIMNGMRSSIHQQPSLENMDGQHKDTSDDHKKFKLDQPQDNALPKIRQVIKNPHQGKDEDDDNDDDHDDLKIYDD